MPVEDRAAPAVYDRVAHSQSAEGQAGIFVRFDFQASDPL